MSKKYFGLCITQRTPVQRTRMSVNLERTRRMPNVYWRLRAYEHTLMPYAVL